jgi:hypothetical protein
MSGDLQRSGDLPSEDLNRVAPEKEVMAVADLTSTAISSRPTMAQTSQKTLQSGEVNTGYFLDKWFGPPKNFLEFCH